MAKTTKPLTFRVDSEVHSDLAKRALVQGVKKSDIARQYVFEGLHASERLAEYQRKLEEVSERLLVVTQELQRLHHQGERTQRWIDASTAVFIAYAERTTPEAGAAKWKAFKER